MTVQETFIIGANPGEYAAGQFIQDSIFKNSRVTMIVVNDVPVTKGFDHNPQTSRLYAGTLQEFAAGATVVVFAEK